MISLYTGTVKSLGGNGVFASWPHPCFSGSKVLAEHSLKLSGLFHYSEITLLTSAIGSLSFCLLPRGTMQMVSLGIDCFQQASACILSVQWSALNMMRIQTYTHDLLYLWL